jgi:hypothetical protein
MRRPALAHEPLDLDPVERAGLEVVRLQPTAEVRH